MTIQWGSCTTIQWEAVRQYNGEAVRQYNGENKKATWTNNDIQNLTNKTKHYTEN